MTDTILRIDNLVKRFGGLVATDHLSLDITRNTLHAVIGPNGAGKTTLIHQLTGSLAPTEGKVWFDGNDVTSQPVHKRSGQGLARSFQITNLLTDFTTLENVALAVQAHSGHSFRFWKPAMNDPTLTEPAMEILSEVGLAARAGTQAALLSHGEQRQLEIAMALATKPSMLLLDEPMAGMGPEDSAMMVEILQRLKGRITILLVEHDMGAVFSLADTITVLVYGREIATGTVDEIRNNDDVRSAYLGDEADHA